MKNNSGFLEILVSLQRNIFKMYFTEIFECVLYIHNRMLTENFIILAKFETILDLSIE